MKIAFAILILLHGLIHSLGFLKAFGIAEIEELKMPVTKPSGIIWLITSLTFVLTSVIYLQGHAYFIGLGFTGILLSQTLIWRDWEDAKFGSIPNVILAIILLLSI
ncbi:hypothetical protein [Gracilimonas sp.]|uniref:hypothetical protein n=1 Tax=Gracilimonas sp. TaxID=1974203 RepID=UPI0028717DBF|nr:hypothetical protein [Gracilimonas sp.]